jgi:hypothetical protein
VPVVSAIGLIAIVIARGTFIAITTNTKDGV